MNDNAYYRLAKVLDTLPSGFPATKSGIEIKILKRIFTTEEADLFCDLKLTPETAEQIAKRTGRPFEGLEERLTSMRQRGEIQGFKFGGVQMFKMMPWVVGIYEFQLNRMDREFAELCEEYSRHWGRQFMRHGPQIMQVIPLEKEIPMKQEALTYQQVSNLIENAQSFMVNECICRKSQGLLDHPCKKPSEVCLALAPLPGVFEDHPWGGKVLDKNGAYEVLSKAEEAGLVHLTFNVESGHHYICNCCGCCCGILRAVKKIPFSVVNSNYYAEIDPDACSACGICADERCQVEAIKQDEGAYNVVRERCIGCGLCASTCPEQAVTLIRKDPEELTPPPKDEQAWLEERARQRKVDFSAYK
jgi:Na+-translocating ferredoxin:NAD+ oxidoreductase subunit B